MRCSETSQEWTCYVSKRKSRLVIYFSELISGVLYFLFILFSIAFFYAVYLLIHKHYVFCFIMCRMKRSSSAVELVKTKVMSRPDAATRALADHGYAAPSQQAARRRHASLPAGATGSTWVPPVVPVCAARQQNVGDATR